MRRFLFMLLATAAAVCAQADLSSEEQEHLRNVLGLSTNTPQDVTRALEQHIAKYPNSPRMAEFDRALARAAVEAKDNRRLVLYGERALARQPGDIPMLDHVARALIQAGDKESARRALGYARRYEETLAGEKPEEGASGAERAKQRETIDHRTGRALMLQAEAQAILGSLEEAVKLAKRAFDVYPGAAPAGEAARWLAALGRLPEAVEWYADAFTVPDTRASDTERATYRRRLGAAYSKWKGSEAGLGDVVLAAYDRNQDRVARRQLALKQFDPNLGLNDPMQFTLTGVEGDKLALSSLAGKVIVMDFWATWCGPCRVQYPLYEQVKQKYASNPNVVFLAISTDEERELVKPFLDTQKWNKRVYFEDGLSSTLRVSSIPTTVIVGKDGQIASRMNGFDPERFVDMLTERIEEASR